MQNTRMKFTEFVDRLLVRLYELDREQAGEFCSLPAVAKSLRDGVPPQWIFDAGKVLETRGLADVLFFFGGTDARITGEGRLYVEEGRGTTKEITSDRQAYYVTVSGDNNQVVTGTQAGAVTQTLTIEQERAPAFKLLDDAIEKLQRDTSLPEPKRAEALSYAHMIKQELTKPEPNRNVIAVVLDPLTKISSIAGQIASLIKLFNAAA